MNVSLLSLLFVPLVAALVLLAGRDGPPDRLHPLQRLIAGLESLAAPESSRERAATKQRLCCWPGTTWTATLLAHSACRC